MGINMQIGSTSQQAEGGNEPGQAKDMVAMQVGDKEAVQFPDSCFVLPHL